ncbi:hypothetical protein ABRY23_00685 [Melioribacteraceae bacterium 4301-Me]|uniref:hypothetical protein n=1 Tax=Pyranulibacter aquaticus TaxID=3163344 RepID=UPI00359C074B
MKKYISSFVCGFGAGVLQIVPIAKSFSCCLILPVASFIAIVLDRKANKLSDKVPLKKALIIGLLTGIYAAIFGSIFDLTITMITKNNDLIAAFPELQRLVNNFPIDNNLKEQVLNLFQKVREEILVYGFSWLYTLSVIVNNFIINTIFGAIGGMTSAQIINSRINYT